MEPTHLSYSASTDIRSVATMLPSAAEAGRPISDAFRDLLSTNLKAGEPPRPTDERAMESTRPPSDQEPDQVQGAWSSFKDEVKNAEGAAAAPADQHRDRDKEEDAAVEATDDESQEKEVQGNSLLATGSNEEDPAPDSIESMDGSWSAFAANLLSLPRESETRSHSSTSAPSTMTADASVDVAAEEESASTQPSEARFKGVLLPQAPGAEAQAPSQGQTPPTKAPATQVRQQQEPLQKNETSERRAAEAVAALEGHKVEAKKEDRRTENTGEVDARRWKVHAEAGPADGTRPEGGRSGNREQHTPSQSEEPRRKAAPKAAESAGEGPERTSIVARRPSTMTELMGDLRPAAGRAAPDAQTNRELFSELVDRARVNLGRDGKSTASIQLNPQHLGRMTLNLELHEGRLQAKVLVDNPEAERVLKQEIDALRRDLKVQGIQLESFAVRLREPSASFEARADQGNQSPSSDTTEGRTGHGGHERDRDETAHLDSRAQRFDAHTFRDIYEDNGSFEYRPEGVLNVSA